MTKLYSYLIEYSNTFRYNFNQKILLHWFEDISFWRCKVNAIWNRHFSKKSDQLKLCNGKGFNGTILLLFILEVYRNIICKLSTSYCKNFHWSRAQCLDQLLKASLNYPTRLLSSNGIFLHSFLHFLWTWIFKTSGLKRNFVERIRHDYYWSWFNQI